MVQHEMDPRRANPKSIAEQLRREHEEDLKRAAWPRRWLMRRRWRREEQNPSTGDDIRPVGGRGPSRSPRLF